MRTAFINQLIEEARHNEKIFLVVGDLGFSVVEPFAQEFADRFINVGIAEQNMIGVAAGLAMAGYNVYVYSIGNFPTLRCMEQIRYDVAYHNLSVKVVAVGGGYSYGSLGASHHATEELGMMRSIPNMIVTAPGDPAETKAITAFSANSASPMYIRLGKAGEPKVHISPIQLIKAGEILTLKEAVSSTAVLSTGAMLDYVIKFTEQNNIACSVYSCPFIKPIDSCALSRIALGYKKIITIEEHQLSTGFGAMIVEKINDMFADGELEKYPIIQRIAIKDKFYSISGSQQFIRDLAGLRLHKSFFID